MRENIPKNEKRVIPYEEAEPNTPDYVPKPEEVDEVECEDLDVE